MDNDTDTPSKVMSEYKGEDVPQNVTHVQFHPSVVEIDNEAFHRRDKLREVVLNEGLREIGAHAFSGCKELQEINIPSTVIKIDEYAFCTCKSLVEVVLNDGLTEIDSYAFTGCSSLQSITIPSTVTNIGLNAFMSCFELKEVELNEGLLEIRDCTFQYCKSLQCIAIPSTVEEIGRCAFNYCTNLRDVVLNDGLKKIGHSAFVRCTPLERITTPSTVTAIGSYAFRGCSSLREVVIHNEGVQIGDDTFEDCTSLERFKFPRLSNRSNNIIQAGQRDIEAKMDDISAVEWRDGELVIPTVRREIEEPWGRVVNVVELDKEKINKIVRLITYYEIKEATTLFELALWKVKIGQADISNPTDRTACRIEVPGPVKDTILQYLQ